MLLLAEAGVDRFVDDVKQRFGAAAAGVLLNEGTQNNLAQGITELQQAGAELVDGGKLVIANNS